MLSLPGGSLPINIHSLFIHKKMTRRKGIGRLMKILGFDKLSLQSIVSYLGQHRPTNWFGLLKKEDAVGQ